jgi:O-antigen/teichoic acid export membrane protein
VLRNLIWRTLVTNFVLTVFGLVNSILLSRTLGPSGRGEIAAAILWPTLLVYLSSFGLITATLYFAALPESKPQAIFGNGALMAVAQGSFAMVIGFVLLPSLLRTQPEAVIAASRLFLLIIPIGLITQYGLSILQGQLRIAVVNQLRLILPAGYLFSTVILILSHRLTLSNIIVLLLVFHSVGLVATLVMLRRIGISFNFRINASLGKEMLKYGGKVHVGSVSGVANANLDQVLIAALLQSRYLGFYVAAVGATGVAQVFSQAVQMVSTPSITRRVTIEERTAVLRGVFRRYWIISLPATVALAAFLPFGIPLIFGAQFNDARVPAEILLVGSLLIGARDVLSGGANALGDPWLGSKAQIWATVFALILLCALLPVLGILGAAIATTLACAIQLGIILYGLQVSHSITWRELLRIKYTDVLLAMRSLRLLREGLEG